MKKIQFLTFTLLITSMLFLPTRVATAQPKATLEGHTDNVWSVAFRPNGKMLASGSWDQTVRLWNVNTGHLLHTLRGHTDTVMSVAFSPDGNTLASGSWDGTIRLWNPRNGKLKRTLREHTNGISSVAFSPDGLTLASGSADTTIRLWNPNNGKLKRTLRGHTNTVDSVAFSPDGATLASGSRDTTIRLWNPNNGKLKRPLIGHTGDILRMMFSPDGATLASGSLDTTIRLWNPRNGRHLRTLINQTGWVNPIAFSPDGATLLIGGHGIASWDIQTGRYKIPVATDVGGALSIAFSPDGEMVACGSEDNKVRLWESIGFEAPLVSIAFDITSIPEPVPPPAAVRDFFQLDTFYQQWINVAGLPVLASVKVDPYAVKEAAWIIWQMIGHRRDVLRVMAEDRERISLLAIDESLSDLPEYETLFNPPLRFLAAYARDVVCDLCNSTLAAEENLLHPDNSFPHFFIHEFAHTIHGGLKLLDPAFDRRLKETYETAMEKGLWRGYYAASNRDEYWAEGTNSWFNSTLTNAVNTRAALKKYDPGLARLLTEIYGDGNWRFKPPATRTHLPHLQGFNPQESLRFDGPLPWVIAGEKLEEQKRDPNSDGDGKWVNLKLQDPSELPSLLASTIKGDSAAFFYMNLTGQEISFYFFDDDGTENFHYRSVPDIISREFGTRAGTIWLVKDHTGEDLAVFRVEEKAGRVMIGGPPSQNILDVNSDGEVDLRDLLPVASRFRERGKDPADVTGDGVINVVDLLWVAAHLSSMSRQAVEGFAAADVQKWLTDARQLRSVNEFQRKGIIFLEHLLKEIELSSKPMRIGAVPLKMIFERHTNFVWSVAFSPDGQTLASGSWDKTIRLANPNTLEHKTTIIEHYNVNSVVFSPDGETLAIGTWDKTIQLWNPNTGELKTTLTGHTDDISSFAFSPDGKTLASGSGDYTIGLWDPDTGEHKARLTEQARITSVAFSPDGKTLASGSEEATIRLWNPETGEVKRILTGHTDAVMSIGFSPDGQTLASSSRDRTIRLWNPNNGKLKKMLTGYTDWINPVAFSPDGTILVIGNGRTIRFWDTQTGEYKNNLEGHTDHILSLAFSPDGTTLASGDEGGTVRLWELTPDVIASDKTIEDVNGDGVVNILDLVSVSSNFGQTGENVADVNGDGIVNIVDLVKVAGEMGAGAAAPAAHSQTLEILTAADVQQWLRQAQQAGLTDATSQRGILMIQQLLAALIPKETSLLPNYPNPFNPETWIPYQLSEPAEVTLHIYAIDGRLIRTLTLGHQPVGRYQSKTRAAYWDGRNTQGERVASGVYFYTLSAGDFMATRKMLIRK